MSGFLLDKKRMIEADLIFTIENEIRTALQRLAAKRDELSGMATRVTTANKFTTQDVADVATVRARFKTAVTNFAATL